MKSWRGPRERGQTSRLQHRTWSDPRLLLGGMLVLGAVVLGSWVVASSDDRVGYWALGEDVVAGDAVTEQQLVESRAVLDDAAAVGALRTEEELPAALSDLRWATDVSAGTLLGNAHLVLSEDVAATELPLAVAAGSAPDDLHRGELVDVWVGPAPGDDPSQTASRVLESVSIVSAGAGAPAEAAAASRTVIIDVGDVELTGEVVGQVSAGHVTLVRRS
ncbi:hypothetical protein [Aeromicrobium sp. CTD01-1L150]|uniref:hypothetical protein n=1 Tax=Aeromicrobium sp. CTD01-1L150 TaxID=3341830 RepID=UPI0035C1BDE3